MIEGQTNIFEMIYPTFKIDKPIRLIEFFAGYGSQALALKYLGVAFEHWKICEWAIKSIQAYKDIHFTNEEFEDTCMTKEQMINFLYEKGISSNYNDPMTKEQISRLNEEQLERIIKNILITHNLVNIQQVKGKDLCIKDADKFTYLLTYSFPCQDLSLAGKGKGMSDTSTRSGMLWEVERILTECKELGTLPQVLLMENVPQVHGADNVEDFNKWQLRLEELGYKNYWQDLIATDYGIPQTRNRTFMVSILGDYNYTFPKPIPLKLKLKDMLEDNVDEKYYLSDKMLQGMINTNFNSYKLESRLQDPQGNVDTLTTSTGARCPHVIPIKNATKKGYLEAKDGDGVDISSRMEYHRGTVQQDKTQTITTMGGENNGVVVDTLKRDLCNKLIQDGLVEEGDVVKHSYTQQILDGNKKCVEKNDGNMITLTTRGDCVGVCVGTYQYAKSDNFMQGKDRLQLGKETSDTLQTSQKEGVVTLYTETEKALFTEDGNIKRYIDSDIVDQFEEGQMATTTFPNGYGHGPRTHNESISLNTIDKPSVKQNLRIRKLTPRETARLMGVRDEDINNMIKNQSDSSMYHLAGDSIVVNVLMAIFKEML